MSGFISLPQVSQVAQTIQLAVAPVFLLAGIGAFLNVCAARLARVIDRARVVEKAVMVSRGEEHDRLVGEIRVLDRRMSVVNGAIFLCVASGCAICLVVILLFASELVDAHLGTAIAILFILAMLLQAAAFGTFIQEIRLAARTIHIRNEVLYHKAEAEEEKRGMTRFTVNDRPVQYRMDPETPLLWALRDASNLTGTKYGCGTGDCGACTVDIDGEAVRSCQVTIGKTEGRFVTTIEALSPDRGHPLQQAFAADNVSQCGYCIPGMIMAASVLLRRSNDPSDEDIDAAITNICRCGIYPRLRGAIKRAGRIMRGKNGLPPAPPPGITPENASKTVPALGKP